MAGAQNRSYNNIMNNNIVSEISPNVYTQLNRHTIRTLTERAIEIQKDMYFMLCFIDYTKAFDKLRHEEIRSMSILDSLNIDGKDLRIVRNIYWDQTAAMGIGNDLSAFQDKERGG